MHSNSISLRELWLKEEEYIPDHAFMPGLSAIIMPTGNPYNQIENAEEQLLQPIRFNQQSRPDSIKCQFR